MKKKTYEINMTEGPILKKIIMFALPMIAGNLLQLLYNTADLVVVSRWTGSTAMASVGATSSLTNLIINLCVGLAVGGSILISRAFGGGDREGLQKGVHTAMCLSLIVGFTAMIVGLLATRPMLTLMGTPEGSVLEGAVLYMSIYFIAVPGTMVYNFSAAILRAIGDTKRPLYILSITGIFNVVFNLVFVIVFKWGVAGVAVSTGIANWLSAAAAVYFLMKTDGDYKLEIKKLKLHREELLETLRIGIPAGLQGSMFSISNTVIQSAVNSFGAAAIAGCAAAANIEGYVYTGMNAFHHATVTGVSQNFGAKKEKRIKHTVALATMCVFVTGALLGLVTVIFDRQLLSIYITDSAEALEFGKIRILFTGLPYFLCGIMEVLAGALRGIGFSTVTAVCSLVGVCGVRLLWVAFVLPFHRTVGTLFTCWPVSWVLVSIIYFVIFKRVLKSSMYKI